MASIVDTSLFQGICFRTNHPKDWKILARALDILIIDPGLNVSGYEDGGIMFYVETKRNSMIFQMLREEGK